MLRSETQRCRDCVIISIVPLRGRVVNRGPQFTHCSGRHTDGALLRAHAIGTGEGRPFADEPIEIRCLDMGIAQSGDGVGPLVVAEQEKNIRSNRRLALRQGRQ